VHSCSSQLDRIVTEGASDVTRVSVHCDTAHIPHSITYICPSGFVVRLSKYRVLAPWQNFTPIVTGVTPSRAAKH
jgi:hypothetical protein